MRVEVVLTPPLDDVVGKRRLQVDLPEGASAYDLIHYLIALDARLQAALLGPHGQVVPAWRVFIDGKVVMERGEGLAAVPLGDGNEVTLLLGLAGGCGAPMGGTSGCRAARVSGQRHEGGMTGVPWAPIRER